MKNYTNNLLMIRPVNFNANEQTAVNNYYQKVDQNQNKENIQLKACAEFDYFIDLLTRNNINVTVVEDTLTPHTPDSIFPNNWISFHSDGRVALYPMFAKNRRNERREDILDLLGKKHFRISEIIDYTSAEQDNFFLEGTGSMVLDRVERIAYAALSPRTDEELFIEFCEDFEYTPVIFRANQTVSNERMPIYHTNVMMSIGQDFAIICLSAIDDPNQRKHVKNSLLQSGKRIIEITEQQLNAFAGNMLQVANADGTHFLVMSKSAKDSLTTSQIKNIEERTNILSAPLEVIETYGGGSARCMMAEVFLPKD